MTLSGTAGMAAEGDGWLAIRALEGNPGAFDVLVRRHSPRVFRFLHQLVRHRQDAEDLTQQTFIKAYRHLASFDAGRPMIHWLLTIARRTALNHFRSARRWEEIPEGAVGDEPSPAVSAERGEDSENLWNRARRILGARDFQVLWLRFGEGLTTAEAAQVAGITTPHVKILIFRARRALIKAELPP